MKNGRPSNQAPKSVAQIRCDSTARTECERWSSSEGSPRAVWCSFAPEQLGRVRPVAYTRGEEFWVVCSHG